MKAAIFSVVAMAMSALAAPLVPGGSSINGVGAPVVNVAREIAPVSAKRNVLDTVSGANDIVRDVAPVQGATSGLPIVKRTISTSDDLIAHLKVAISAVLEVTVTIDALVGKVSAGSLSADDCTKQVVPALHKVVTIVAGIVANISADVSIDITVAAHLQIIVDLVVKLLTTILVSLKGLVVSIGLRVEIKAIIATICSLLGNLLTLLVTVVAGLLALVTKAILPLLLDIVDSLLGSVLGAVLTPVGGLLVGLQISISL